MLFGNHVFFLSLIFSKLNFFKYSVKSVQIESFPLPYFSILKCVTGTPANIQDGELCNNS